MAKHCGSKQSIKAIILAGGCDFGRCQLAGRLPAALWPVAGRAVLERLLVSLADQGIGRAVICSSGGASLLAESIQVDGCMELEFLDESLPVGTAGAVRDAAGSEKDGLFLVFPASVVCPPKIDVLLDAHRQGQSDLTVMFNPAGQNGRAMGEASGIYVCNSAVLELIPKAGYFDIKEGLIPEMLRVGKGVHAAVLPVHAGNFRDRREYLDAVGNYLQSGARPNTDLRTCERRDSQNVWIAASAKVHSAARIYEPVVILDGASVSDGAVIIGPTVLGSNVNVGKDAVVVNSVVWDGAQLGPNCRVQRCLVDYQAVVRANAIVQEESKLIRRERALKGSIGNVLGLAKEKMSGLERPLRLRLAKIGKRMSNWAGAGRKRPIMFLGAALVLIAFLWSYRPELAGLWGLWQRSDEYSSGLLVPFLAVYVLWTRRHDIARCEIRPCVLWGLFAFVGAQAFRLFGLFFMYGSAERLSIVLSIGAIVLLLFGWRLLRKVFTVLLFLFLMVPWPNRIQGALTLPLQSWATSSAVFCLEMVGYDVVQHGNVIDMEGTVVAVAEACNGLRMVTAFFVISGLVVLLVKRAWWEKLIVLALSLPVALLCNTVRLAITAIAFTMLDGEQWEGIFHDFGGYAMMPLALAAMVAELWLLRKLTTVPTQQEAIVITRQDG